MGGSGNAIKGGGIYCYDVDSSTIITDNTFRCYVDWGDGGGIYCENASPVIRNNIISHNLAERGGAIYCTASSPSIINNTLEGNRSWRTGSGIYLTNDSDPTIEYCIITNGSGYYSQSPIYGIYVEDAASQPIISCCDVYNNETGNYGGYLSDQNGINGNFGADPLFCDTGHGVFTLRCDSPYLPGQHPDGYECGLIGALGWGCVLENPFIFAIDDIGNDQGRQVSVAWYRSDWDTVGSSQAIQTYEVYRRIDDLPSQFSVEHSEIPEVNKTGEGNPAALYPPGDWHYLFSVPAHCEDKYAVVASTLEDSCQYNTTDYHSIFFVRAATSAPGVYFDSAPDSGYSVDNLPPVPPAGLVAARQYIPAEGVQLSWDHNTEIDFSFYKVHRGSTAEFVPSPDNMIMAGLHTNLFDGDYSGDDRYCYKVSAMDWNGNESEYATIETTDITGDEVDIPTVNYLAQNYPNPFNPATTIRFGLKERSHVRIAVFNVAGQVVRILVDEHWPAGRYEVTWDGKNRRGVPVGSGIYFYRMVTADCDETRKMILLR
jgi:predicted outer membrane repeat protein